MKSSLLGYLLFAILSVIHVFEIAIAFPSPVKLVTRSSTVVRRGLNGIKTVGKNVQWLAQVSFGTPAQQFELLIDTGSSNILVTTTDCDPGCRTQSTKFFDTKQSTTYDRVSKGSYSIYSVRCLVYDLAVDVITLGELRIRQQNSDLSFDGILGLGFDKITQPTNFGVETVLTTMFKQKLASIYHPYQELGGGAILDDIYVDDIDLEVGGPFIFDTGATYIFAPCSIVE
ncbi:10624_t:CDS:2, partial [Ambispora gerdemannii]